MVWKMPIKGKYYSEDVTNSCCGIGKFGGNSCYSFPEHYCKGEFNNCCKRYGDFTSKCY